MDMPWKGSQLSETSVQRMKQSKQRRMQSKFDWSIAEPYLDTILDNGSRNRKAKFITLREFRELIESGRSLKDIRLDGISKHIVNFYSLFCQGKINLSKAHFLIEYESGLGLDEIAEKYSISRDNMTFLRQLYDVKARGATFQHRKATETPLTQRQKEILYGSMLGDAKQASLSSVAFKQGEKQKDYLLWKYREFENVASKNSLKSFTVLDPRSGQEHTSWQFYTHANTDVEACVDIFYQNGKKDISQPILDQLTALSVAVWFMDDGKTDFHHRHIKGKMHQINPECMFCTESFSKEGCELACRWFRETWGLSAYLRTRKLSNGTGYRICIRSPDTDKFFDVIRPYVLPLFMYKISYRKYIEEKTNSDIALADIIGCPVGEEFVSLSIPEQEGRINQIVSYWHRRGVSRLLPYPKYFKKDMKRVLQYDADRLLHDDYIAFCTLGNNFLMSHFPNFYEAKAKGGKSAAEIFNNERYLSEIVRGILQDGHFPRGNRIRSKLSDYRGNRMVSGFMPCVAKSIYHRYCDTGFKVLDFCAGYGGRLFGAMACEKIVSYTGIEVNYTSYDNLCELRRSLKLYGNVCKPANLINADAIEGMRQFSDKYFDFAFTSVPYFDCEEYSDQYSQSFRRYANYAEWFEKFLLASISEAKRVSKVVLLNVANTGAYQIAEDLASAQSVSPVDNIRMSRRGGGTKFEPLFLL